MTVGGVKGNLCRLAVVLFVIGLLCTVGVAHEWMAPKEAGNRKNPIPVDEKSTAKGKVIYVESCSLCHGENIEGLEAQIVGLEKSPPNLKKRIQTHSDGDFFWKIQEGRGDMPSFKEGFGEENIWNVINYIRSETQ